MSLQPQFPGIFAPAQATPQIRHDDDALPLPATEKQLHYAQSLALKSGQELPRDIATDRVALSAWIEAHKPRAVTGQFANYPSSKQVAFAERIARLKRREIPPECFHDKVMLSRWIDGNKPR